MLAATAASRRGGALLFSRLYSSALNGNRSPLDNVINNNNPMLHQQDSNSIRTEEDFELRVPGECKWRNAYVEICLLRAKAERSILSARL